MLETISCVFFIVEIFITLGFSLYIVAKADKLDSNRNSFMLVALWDSIKKLFVNKNWFGIILGVIIFILVFPAIIFLFLFEVIIWLIVLVTMIWDLGNKKER